ncbi:MAG: PAS domain-containing protein [Actinobacteria bacterium]|nr:PAS domain-containing protein [Actinomycetota bacterium]
MSRIEHTPHSAAHAENRLEFEALISDLSSRFINLPPDEVDDEIEDAQRRVCEVLGVDLSALWEETAAADGTLTLTLTHFYGSREDLLPPMRGMSAQEYFPWLQLEMLAGRIVAVSSLDELPEPAAFDRDNLRLFGVKSNLTVPLSVGGASPVAALGFNTTRAERDWPDALVRRLQLVAQVFTNALARKRADEALRESEERLALAADSAEAGLWILDHATEVFWVTERTRMIFGYAPHEVVDVECFMSVVHPEDRDLVREAMERAEQASEPVSTEYRILLGDGRVRWVSSRGRARFASTGEPDRLMGVSIDITERMRAQGALRESEARLEAGVELAGLAFYEVDFDEGSVYVDDRFRDLCGIPPEREQGLQALEFWIEHLHPDDRPRVLNARQQLHDGEMEQLFVEYRFLPPCQGQKWIQHSARVATRDATGRTLKSYGVLRDITGRKRAEDELRDLSQRLIGAHEEERALLARELHDDVSQRLAVLAIDVGRAELAAPDKVPAAAMQEVRSGLVRLSEDIHSLAYQLHPSVLEELGLVEALRTECERRGRQGQLDLSLDLDSLPTAIGKDAALCLFRVAQEALNNVARHAGVRAARVTLRPMDGGLLLAVSDGGVGFDAEHPGEGMHLGLASMRERVRLVDGTLDIESAPDRGTTILAWVPAGGGSQ